MLCKNCSNKEGFLVMVTDYKPLELWEFNEGTLTRYNQKDSGDMEVSFQCAACGSDNIDREGFEMGMHSDRPLVILSDEEWEEKLDALKKEEAEDLSDEAAAESGSEEASAEEPAAEDSSAEASAEAEAPAKPDESEEESASAPDGASADTEEKKEE